MQREVDFRVRHYLEARDQIKEANKYTELQAGYWANMAAAAVNALMASFPDSLMDDLEAELEYRRTDSLRVQRAIKRKLRES